MKFSFKFSNLLGTVYQKGNLVFSADGNSIYSPVGNRITIFDLKRNTSKTLEVDNKFNYVSIDISPNGLLLAAVNEQGQVHILSLISKTIVHKYRLNGKVSILKFSPDGNYLVVLKENKVFVFQIPGMFFRRYNAFEMVKVFHQALDDTVCIDWSSNSKFLAVGSKDMTIRIHNLNKNCKTKTYCLNGYRENIVSLFFEKDSLDITSVSSDGQICIWECNKDLYIEEFRSVPIKKIGRYESDSEDYDNTFQFEINTKMLQVNLNIDVCESEISTITINPSGDWIALGSSELGHLLVWEWQSETYIMKQQGHCNSMTCLGYSPDGKYIVTGGFDGKVKLWNTSSGFCFVTFTEHSSNVTDVQFSPNGKFIASSSLDGTIRAFDLIRYRNFKTFTSPLPVQFICLAIDSNSEFIAAGGQDVFEIYLWSLKIGRLCEVLSGHEGPVAGIEFSPVVGSTTLASVSWDKTLRLWNAVNVNQEHEVFLLSNDGLAVTFRSDGEELAVATLNGQISFFNVKNRLPMHVIEGKNDLVSGTVRTDLISSKNNVSARAFYSLSYTPAGSSILAGGQSKIVCIYDVQTSMLLKKFEISQNRSLSNIDEFISRRKITEFGNMDLIEERGNDNVKIRLPGVLHGNFSSRSLKPAIRVFCLEFSPSGLGWAAATTEGLLLFSQDLTLLFDPFELTVEITSEALQSALKEADYAKALMMAIKVGEKHLIQKAIESVPCSDIELCLSSITQAYLPHIFKFISLLLNNSTHLEFYLKWIRTLLTIFKFKAGEFREHVPILLNLQKNLFKYFEEVGKLCESNKYAIEFLLHIGKFKNENNFIFFNGQDDENEIVVEN